MYTVLILAHTIDNSFNKENRIKHDLHLEVCHISKELDRSLRLSPDFSSPL